MAHPILTQLAKVRVRQALRQGGVSFVESVQLAATVDSDLFDMAVSLAPPEARAQLDTVSGIGDGTLLQRFLDFLNSDLGKMVVEIIRKLLLGL